LRITLEAKQRTRERILETAERLFRKQGFETATTRELAQAAGIASGTLFNYFASKEAIALELVLAALERAVAACERRASGLRNLEEDLYALIAAGLRELRPLRSLVPAVIETCLGAARCSSGGNEGAEALRLRQLEAAGRLAQHHGVGEAFSALAQELYWTLYTGVLAYWSRDESPRQEDTLAYLDAALKMFVEWLTRSSSPRRKNP